MHDPSTRSIGTLIDRLLPDLTPEARERLAGIARDERPIAGGFLMREGRPTLLDLKVEDLP
jgi:hypothetical protein